MLVRIICIMLNWMLIMKFKAKKIIRVVIVVALLLSFYLPYENPYFFQVLSFILDGIENMTLVKLLKVFSEKY